MKSSINTPSFPIMKLIFFVIETVSRFQIYGCRLAECFSKMIGRELFETHKPFGLVFFVSQQTRTFGTQKLFSGDKNKKSKTTDKVHSIQTAEMAQLKSPFCFVFFSVRKTSKTVHNGKHNFASDFYYSATLRFAS